jgi:hypothetical protein
MAMIMAIGERIFQTMGIWGTLFQTNKNHLVPLAVSGKDGTVPFTAFAVILKSQQNPRRNMSSNLLS